MAQHTAPVVVASVQTLARRSRLERIARDVALVIVDEAHHAMAPSWRSVLRYLGCFAPIGPLTVGFTATPERGDGVDLGEVFEGITYSRDILAMIREGYLADLRGLQIRLDVNLDRVCSCRGDFVESELACEMERADTPAHVVRAYHQGMNDTRVGKAFCAVRWRSRPAWVCDLPHRADGFPNSVITRATSVLSACLRPHAATLATGFGPPFRPVPTTPAVGTCVMMQYTAR